MEYQEFTCPAPAEYTEHTQIDLFEETVIWQDIHSVSQTCKMLLTFPSAFNLGFLI